MTTGHDGILVLPDEISIPLNPSVAIDEVMERLRSQPTVSVPDVALVFGVSESTGYRAVAAGDWPAVRARTRKRVRSTWVLEQLGLAGETP